MIFACYDKLDDAVCVNLRRIYAATYYKDEGDSTAGFRRHLVSVQQPETGHVIRCWFAEAANYPLLNGEPMNASVAPAAEAKADRLLALVKAHLNRLASLTAEPAIILMPRDCRILIGTNPFGE